MSVSCVHKRSWLLPGTGKACKSALLTCLLTLVCIPSNAANPGYPYRLPDWIWKNPVYQDLVSPSEFMSIESDIVQISRLEKLQDQRAAESLKNSIAKRLAEKFNVRDLSTGSFLVSNQSTGVSLAFVIDPTFDPVARQTIEQAAILFVEVAMDPNVIKRAWERASSTPAPMPERFEIENGATKLDEIGRPIYTQDYANSLRYRVKPASVESFIAELKNDLTTQSGDPVVVVISQNWDDYWWGRSYYGFFSDPIQQLSRDGPPRGYIYTGFNRDRIKSPEPGWNDPKFWASKIAHELLHSIGYWHPVYKNVEERDAHNNGKEWDFIVSYEFAVLQEIRARKGTNP